MLEFICLFAIIGEKIRIQFIFHIAYLFNGIFLLPATLVVSIPFLFLYLVFHTHTTLDSNKKRGCSLDIFFQAALGRDINLVLCHSVLLFVLR